MCDGSPKLPIPLATDLKLNKPQARTSAKRKHFCSVDITASRDDETPSLCITSKIDRSYRALWIEDS